MQSLIKVSEIDGITKVIAPVENFCELAQYMTLKFGCNWNNLFWQDEELEEEEGIMCFESKLTALSSKLELLNY